MPRKACWFHFCQAAKKRASSYSAFVHEIKHKTDVRDAYYKLMALPLLPPGMITSSFQFVKSQLVDVPSAKESLAYFEKQWILKVNQFIESAITSLPHTNVNLLNYRYIRKDPKTSQSSNSPLGLHVHWRLSMASWEKE